LTYFPLPDRLASIKQLQIIYIKALILFLDLTGLNALFRWLNRNKVLILWYHGVCDNDFSLLKGYDERHISKDNFEKQLKFLKKKNYHFLNLSEYLQKRAKNKFPKRSVILTFDDGFKNVVKNAYPLMVKYRAKGCFYLVAGLIGSNDLLWTDFVEVIVFNHLGRELVLDFKGEITTFNLKSKKDCMKVIFSLKSTLRSISNQERLEIMEQFKSFELRDVPKEFLFSSWEDVSSLDPNILEIGCHSQSHPNLTQLTTESEIEEELYASKKSLESKLTRRVIHFCYPAGAYNQKIMNKLKDYGYQSSTTIKQGFNTPKSSLLQLKRMSVIEDFRRFKAIASGSCYALIQLKEKLLSSRH